MTITAEHSSGLHSVEPAALKAALTKQLADEPDFLSLTEMMSEARAAVLDDFPAYAVARARGAEGQDECAALLKRSTLPDFTFDAVRLSELPIPRRSGKFCDALVIKVDDSAIGPAHTRIIVHLPSGVEDDLRDGAGGVEGAQARVYRDAIEGLKRLVASIAGPVVITGDWNLDLRKAWVREYLKRHFPEFVPTWGAGDLPELGTHGARVIDFSLVRGFSVTAAHVVPDFGASDHRAIRETHKEIRMATPMTPAQWRAQLRKFNVPFREIGDFALSTSGRDDETGKIFGPVYGVVIHHTGSDGADSINRELIDRGRSDLAGPLAQSGLDDLGVIDMFTWRRANHAGGGDPDVLAAVKAESYGDYPPHTDKHQGESGAVDGNDCFYGLETYYSGSHPMTAKQYRSAVAWAAAICDFHGWTAKSVIGHKEWSDWKPDPGQIDMKVFRRDVQALLDGRNVVEGPVFTTPRITKAIAANIAYDKALDAILFGPAQDEVTTYRAQLKKQRVALRDMERK